ncbi:MAG: glycosyltransferase [Candidatus Omnitrophota bacterium]
MDSQSKILILYATAGHGHEKAAKAVAAALKEKHPQANVVLSDILTLCAPYYGASYRKSYLAMIRDMSWLWGFLYYGSDVSFIYRLLKPLRRLNNALLAKPLHQFIVAQNPDVIISTHFMSTEVASYLKRKGSSRARLVTVVTDYLPHYFWVGDGVDAYVCAIPEGKRELVKRGAPEDRIRIMGIPTDKKFSHALPRGELLLKHQVEDGVFTVLLTSGGAGVGAARKIAEALLELDKPVQVLAVCGTNEALKNQLTQLKAVRPRLKVFGFVDTMDELMQLSDVIVGKGGGLTVTEAMCKGKPMIIFQPVPGQESRNADCLSRASAAVTAGCFDDVIAKVKMFLNDPLKLKEYQETARRYAHPSSAVEIADLAVGLIPKT